MSSDFIGISLTPAAVAKARTLRHSRPDWLDLSLRVYLGGKGCDGFTYGVTFDQPTPADVHFPQDEVDVVVDPDTLEFIAGATVDWVDDERGQGFLVENPRHRAFRGKFYKKGTWQERLKQKRAPSQ